MTKFKVKIGDGVRQWNDLPYIGGDSSVLHNAYEANNITIDNNTTENHVYILKDQISAFTITVDAIMASESIVSFKASTDFSLTVAGAQASNIKRIGSFDFKANNEYTISICGDSLVSSVGVEMPSMLATEYRQNEMSGEATTKTSPISIDGDTITISKNIHDVVHVDYADYYINTSENKIEFVLGIKDSRQTDYKTDDMFTIYTDVYYRAVKSDAVLYVCDNDNALYIYDSINDEFKHLPNKNDNVVEVSHCERIQIQMDDGSMIDTPDFWCAITPKEFLLRHANEFISGNGDDCSILTFYINDDDTNWRNVYYILHDLQFGSAIYTYEAFNEVIHSVFRIVMIKYRFEPNYIYLHEDKVFIYEGKILKEQLGEHNHVEIDGHVIDSSGTSASCSINIKDNITTYISNIDCSSYNRLVLSYKDAVSLDGKEWIVYLTYDTSKTTPISISIPSELKVVGAIPELLPDENVTHIISMHDNVVVFGTAKTLQD